MPANQSVMQIRSKFNSILEERLLDSNANNHYIISIDINLQEFHASGDLTQEGMAQFWVELNKGLQHFEDLNDNVSLRPRQKFFRPKANLLGAGTKLPSPPRKVQENHKREHSRSRSHKRSHSRSRHSSKRPHKAPIRERHHRSHSHDHRSVKHYY